MVPIVGRIIGFVNSARDCSKDERPQTPQIGLWGMANQWPFLAISHRTVRDRRRATTVSRPEAGLARLTEHAGPIVATELLC